MGTNENKRREKPYEPWQKLITNGHISKVVTGRHGIESRRGLRGLLLYQTYFNKLTNFLTSIVFFFGRKKVMILCFKSKWKNKWGWSLYLIAYPDWCYSALYEEHTVCFISLQRRDHQLKSPVKVCFLKSTHEGCILWASGALQRADLMIWVTEKIGSYMKVELIMSSWRRKNGYNNVHCMRTVLTPFTLEETSI